MAWLNPASPPYDTSTILITFFNSRGSNKSLPCRTHQHPPTPSCQDTGCYIYANNKQTTDNSQRHHDSIIYHHHCLPACLALYVNVQRRFEQRCLPNEDTPFFSISWRDLHATLKRSEYPVWLKSERRCTGRYWAHCYSNCDRRREQYSKYWLGSRASFSNVSSLQHAFTSRR